MFNKPLLLCTFSLFALSCAKQKSALHFLPSGKYVGMDYMGVDDITPTDSTDKWYHENTLTVRDDSLFLKSVPVVIYKNQQKAYSSSDGGFYFYQGKMNRKENKLIAQLLLTSHDYVAPAYFMPDSMKSKADSNISFEEKVKRGIYIVDSSFFKKQWLLVESAEGFTLDGVSYTGPDKH